MAKISKAAADYRDHPVNGLHCSRCNMFRDGSCTAVDGAISRHGHCKLWQWNEKLENADPADIRSAVAATDHKPTDAQKAAGNYAKGKFDWCGLPIAVENGKGWTRSGVGPNGRRWTVVMPALYGYVLRTEANDGDHVDVYVGDAHTSKRVWVVNQVDADTKKYDEPKCLLSFPSKEAALATYVRGFSDGNGRERIGGVKEMSIGEFREWVNSDAAKRKAYAAGGAVHSLVDPTAEPTGSWFDNLPRAKQADAFDAVMFDSLPSPWAPWRNPSTSYVPRTPTIHPDDLMGSLIDSQDATRTRNAYAAGGKPMPLDKSGTKASVGRNIAAEVGAGKPRRQAIAIALNTARRYAKKASGGRVGRAAGGATLVQPLIDRRADEEDELPQPELRVPGIFNPNSREPIMPDHMLERSEHIDARYRYPKQLQDDFAIGGMPGGHPFGMRGKHMPGMPPPMPRMGFAPGGWIGEDVQPADLTRDILPPRPRNDLPPHLLEQQANGIPGAKLSGGSGAGSAVGDIATELAKAFLHAQGEKMRSRATASPEERFAGAGNDLAGIGRNVKDVASSFLPDFDPGAETERLSKPGTIGENLTDFAKKAPGAALAVAPYAGNAERLAAGPGRSLMDAIYKTAPRVGMTTLAAGAPDFIEAAQSGNPAEARKAERDKLEAQIEAARKGIADTALKIGAAKFRGNDAEAGAARKAAIEEASKPFNSGIAAAEKRIAQLQAADDAESKEAEARGAPLREGLHPVLSKTVPIWTGAIGAAATRGVFNKWNAEYNQAMKAYQAAEKSIDPVQMAVRKAQIAQLEKNTPWKNPLTYLAAGIPAELRSIEQAIDMRSPEGTRAHDEAYKHLHDPLGLGVDVGTNLLSAATALGLGAKFSKNQPERSLGQAISGPTDPYGGAPALADQYGSALRAGEALRSQYPNGPSGPSQQRGILQRLLGTGPAKASGVPGTTVAQPTSPPSPIELKAHPEPFDASALDALDATRQRILNEGPVRPALPAPAPVAAANQPKPAASSAPDPSNTVILDPHGARYPAGHPENIGGKFATPGPDDTVMTRAQWNKAQREAAKAAKSKDSAQSLTKGKGNKGGTPGKDTGVPDKPERLPDEDWLKGRKSGGPVQKALDFARKFARGGRVTVGPVVGATGGRTDALPVDVPSGAFVIPADVVSALGEGNTLGGNKALDQMFGKQGAKAHHQPIGIKISDGEYVIDPETVAKIGGGDMDRGHRMLDQFVLDTRKKHIAQLSSLPGPSR